MTERAVQDLVQRIAQVEEHVNTAGQAIRDATLRAQVAENRARAAETAAAAGAAGVRQGTVSHCTGRHLTFGKIWNVQWSTC